MCRQCQFEGQGPDATAPELSQVRDLSHWIFFPCGGGVVKGKQKKLVIGFWRFAKQLTLLPESIKGGGEEGSAQEIKITAFASQKYDLSIQLCGKYAEN